MAWDDANYAVDEQWAVLYPRSEALSASEAKSIELRIANHSSESRSYKLRFNLPENVVSSDELSPTITVQAGKIGTASIRIKATGAWKGPSWRILTADIQTEGIHVREWCDAYLTKQEAAR